MGDPDPAFDYRAYDAADVPALERKGWVRCTEAEAREYWESGLGELIALKRRKKLK